jgi:Fe-S cluster assembly protein SufD
MEDGALIYIPKGTVVGEPIHLLYVSTETDAPIITHPRNLIVAGEESQAAIVEHYVSTTDGVYFSNAVTEVVVGDGGVLSHYLIELESKDAFNVSTLRVEQGRSSSVTSHSALIGGALVRNNVHPVMAGEGGDCLISGLFMAKGRQHIDNYMRVEHVGPHCGSRQFYNGIMDGRSRGVFHGRIVVHKGAQKTDAKQTNRNLLLSEEAQIDTKPQLEIYADDVKCTHGATIGQIDENAIFYLRSRGISEEASRAILLFAFANESLERMKVEPIRRYLGALVAEWMPHGEMVEVSV